MSARTIGTGYVRRISHGVGVGQGQTNNVDDWRYAGNDDYAAVTANNFWNPLAADLRVGSMIHCSLDLDGTPQGVTLMVTAISSGVVTVAATRATAIA